MNEIELYSFQPVKKPISKVLLLMLIASLLILAASYFGYWNVPRLLAIEKTTTIEGILGVLLPVGQPSLVIENQSFVPFKVLLFSLEIYGADGSKLLLMQNPKPKYIPPRAVARIPVVPVRIEGATLNPSNLGKIRVQGEVTISILGIKFKRKIDRQICNVSSVSKL